jgi:signal transduction histidine kinase
MRLGTRLLLPLVAVMTLVMLLFAAWSVRHRERILRTEAQRETRAYAVALGLALEGAYRDPDLAEVQAIIDRISLEETVAGVLIYDRAGEILFVSDQLQGTVTTPPAQLREVLDRNLTVGFDRTIGDQPVYSVLRPIHDAADIVVGAFEVAQPLSLLSREIARTRLRFALNTLTLVAAVAIAILVLVRHLVAQPLERIVAGARALGRGELGYRIGAGQPGEELRVLAAEFDGMAAQIETARTRLVAEAEERIGLERRLRETEKMAAVGNLAAGLAHEIAAPLHVIRGRAEQLLRQADLPQAQRRHLGIIIEQIDRISFIVRNLLDFARRREPLLAQVELKPVLASVAEFLEAEFARRDVAFTLEVEDGLRAVADVQLLHQVLLNLLMNALQALESTDDGARVAVRARESDEDGVTRVVIDVHDTGTGIPDDVLLNIFDPFFTTRGHASGTGLGLAIARSIVEEHGGTIVAVNHSQDDAEFGGRGALFRVVLPAATATEPAHA